MCDRILCLSAKVTAGTILLAMLQPPNPSDGISEIRNLDCNHIDGSDDSGGSCDSSGSCNTMAEDGLSEDSLIERVLHAGLEYGRTSAWVWALYLFLGTSIDIGQVTSHDVTFREFVGFMML